MAKQFVPVSFTGLQDTYIAVRHFEWQRAGKIVSCQLGLGGIDKYSTSIFFGKL